MVPYSIRIFRLAFVHSPLAPLAGHTISASDCGRDLDRLGSTTIREIQKSHTSQDCERYVPIIADCTGNIDSNRWSRFLEEALSFVGRPRVIYIVGKVPFCTKEANREISAFRQAFRKICDEQDVL